MPGRSSATLVGVRVSVDVDPLKTVAGAVFQELDRDDGDTVLVSHSTAGSVFATVIG